MARAATSQRVVQPTSTQRGVTMMELMITLAIVAILAALAAPSFSNFVADVRQSSVMGELASDLHLARSESIKRNALVKVCPLAAGNTCGGGSDWGVGWLICYVNALGECDLTNTTADPNPIKVHGALNGPVALDGPIAAVLFRPIGTANVLSVFTLTNTSGAGPKRVTNVSPAGSITTVKQ